MTDQTAPDPAAAGRPRADARTPGPVRDVLKYGAILAIVIAIAGCHARRDLRRLDRRARVP